MGDLGSSNVLSGGRPRISIRGQVQNSLSTGLLSMLIEETHEGLKRCELTVGNWGSTSSGNDFLYFDRSLLEFGETVRIDAGEGSTGGVLFQGRISGLEGQFPSNRPPQLVVLAEDRLQDLRMTRRTRTFEDATDADVFSRIASDHGLTPDVSLDGPTWKVLAQLNQSDLAFLRDRARALGAELWVDDTTLFARVRPAREAGSLTLTNGQGLRELSILADLSHQRTGLTVSGWDVQGKDAAVHEATEACLQSEIGQGQGGAAVLQSTFGDRKDTLMHLHPGSPREAQAMAEGRYRQLGRRFLTGQAEADGDARIKVGAKVTFQGVGPLFNGEYTIVETRHFFDMKNGFSTRFSVERAFIGRP